MIPLRPPSLPSYLALLALVLTAAGCVSRGPADGPPPSGEAARIPPVAVPGPEPRSRYGNPPFYEVAGRRYRVRDTSAGYAERGTASWYGRKFHGRRTSSGETYDMYALTAAHKTLPIPCWVEVRHLGNGRSVTVRVNDRGPFVGERIIDLSYAAAKRLGMVRSGTAEVEVRALDFGSGEAVAGTASGAETVAETVAIRETVIGPRELYAQVGAFGDRTNALRRQRRLAAGGFMDAFVYEDPSVSPALYRVRVGPMTDVGAYERTLERIRALGIEDVHLVAD